MSVQTLPIANIKADTRAQPRLNLNTDVTLAYQDALQSGAKFPPLTVFFDGESYWLADGFHRRYAAMSAGLTEFSCEVREGGLRDAILHSCGANAEHGYQRSNEDKRRAVIRMLEDDEWRGWSDREIARQCMVSHEFVRKMRPVTVNDDSEKPAARTYTTKHGTVATMNTAAIGSNPSPRTPAPERRIARETAGRPAPAPVRGKDAMCVRVKDALMALASLPPAHEVAGYFAGSDLAVIVDEQLPAAAQWLNDFSEAWGDPDNA